MKIIIHNDTWLHHPRARRWIYFRTFKAKLGFHALSVKRRYRGTGRTRGIYAYRDLTRYYFTRRGRERAMVKIYIRFYQGA